MTDFALMLQGSSDGQPAQRITARRTTSSPKANQASPSAAAAQAGAETQDSNVIGKHCLAVAVRLIGFLQHGTDISLDLLTRGISVAMRQDKI